MSAAAITPKLLSGPVDIPPSKSVAHRAVISASLAGGESRIVNLELSQDIEATVGAMRAMGADIRLSPASGGRLQALVRGVQRPAGMPLIDCRESGSTLRFLIPVALAVCGGAVFAGTGRLVRRPIGPYLDIFKRQGIQASLSNDGLPLSVAGALKPGDFIIPGGISSQFVTGLMLALPLLGGASEIEVIGALESLPYVDITIDVLKQFGIDIVEAQRGALYRLDGKQVYRPLRFAVEGDWSQAAFPLLMGMLGGPVAVSGLDPASRQGDKAVLDIYRDMGGDIVWEGDVLVARRSGLRAADVDVSQVPDLAPAVAAAMAAAEGESRITGGKRLRSKESDRIAAVAACLNGLGADVTETEDGMVIRGRRRLSGGAVQSFNDHRIAMMAAGVSPICSEQVSIQGHGAVAKSWPGFWQAFRRLGGQLDEQPVG